MVVFCASMTIGPVKGGCMQKEGHGVSDRTFKSGVLGTLVFCVIPLFSGCVVLEEKYNAEKARSLNFQRLLAQEEKRTAELDSEVKRTKKELTEFEARNRELTAQVQSAREQMARLQEEAEAIKESALLERKAMEEMRKGGTQSAKKKPAKTPDILGDLSSVQADLPKDLSPKDDASVPEPAPAGKTGATIHVVKPGETLFRISRRYGIDIDKLRKMNKLPDDIIEVGQKLIVGME
jgi:LysM repeat protein